MEWLNSRRKRKKIFYTTWEWTSTMHACTLQFSNMDVQEPVSRTVIQGWAKLVLIALER
jgi:hypothetical protein